MPQWHCRLVGSPKFVTDTQVWLPITQQVNTQEMSFEWKGIIALFRRLIIWGEGELLSKGQLQGFCLTQGFLKELGQLISRGSIVVHQHFLITCRLNGASYRPYLGAWSLSKGLIQRGLIPLS